MWLWPGVGAAESECGQEWVRPSLSVAVVGGGCGQVSVWLWSGVDAAESEYGCGRGWVRPSLSVAVAGGGCGRV